MRYVKTERLNLRLYDEDKAALRELGDKYGMNMTEVIIKLIQDRYAQEKRKEMESK